VRDLCIRGRENCDLSFNGGGPLESWILKQSCKECEDEDYDLFGTERG